MESIWTPDKLLIVRPILLVSGGKHMAFQSRIGTYGRPLHKTSHAK